MWSNLWVIFSSMFKLPCFKPCNNSSQWIRPSPLNIEAVRKFVSNLIRISILLQLSTAHHIPPGSLQLWSKKGYSPLAAGLKLPWTPENISAWRFCTSPPLHLQLYHFKDLTSKNTAQFAHMVSHLRDPIPGVRSHVAKVLPAVRSPLYLSRTLRFLFVNMDLLQEITSECTWNEWLQVTKGSQVILYSYWR